MQRVYLYVNAALYLLFALWCTVAPNSTRSNIGYKQVSTSGQSEYLVIYGGLQLGLALIFLMLARDPALNRSGMQLAVALYAPIVLYRLISVIRYWPVSSLTLATAGLELALLIGALGLWFAASSS